MDNTDFINKKFGYLVPEFPGQTHAFFWRELKELVKRGAEPMIISTRPPRQSLVCHDWSQQAISETTYLSPMNVRQLFVSLIRLLITNPIRIFRAWKVILSNPKLSLLELFRTATLLIPAAHLVNIANEQNWNHVHVHSAARSAMIARLSHELSGMTYSIMLHGPLSDYGEHQNEKWEKAAFGLVITDTLLEEMPKHLNKELSPPLFKAQMGVDISNFVRKSPYQPWNNNDPIRIFSCGRLNPCKGHDDLIIASSLLKKKGLSVKLHIAGTDDSNGDYYIKLKELITDLDLAENVSLLGAITEDAIKNELEHSHFFALASLAEPLGVAIMEAMAMEVPVIVTEAGGVTELVRTGIDGITIPVNKPQSIADEIEKLLSKPELTIQMGKNGCERISQHFHSGKSAEVLISCISKSYITNNS